ncbi:hypothetical protein ENHAE0001_0848 [Enhydrobacter aerosaccus SK60]|nr:hypothetical protein ENHAE0001_0848 [Enhydrobacter aerosaccus SK60]
MFALKSLSCFDLQPMCLFCKHTKGYLIARATLRHFAAFIYAKISV